MTHKTKLQPASLTRGLHLNLHMPVRFLIVNRQPLLHQEVVAASCLQIFDQDVLQHPRWGQTWGEDQSMVITSASLIS